MFGKFMNNYYYGKAGKGDYRKEDLPRTRWQLFWEMLRVRFSGLVQLNLITALEINFDIEFSQREAFGFKTVGELRQSITEKLRG